MRTKPKQVEKRVMMKRVNPAHRPLVDALCPVCQGLGLISLLTLSRMPSLGITKAEEESEDPEIEED